jgi:serine/threonine protein kinase
VITPGTIIDGRYEIVGPLATGGMGEVYRAVRRLLGDEVAVKVMHQAAAAPEDLKRRFLRESRACAQLHHPNIVSILDFNVDAAGQPYMVMELLTGPTLGDEMQLSGAMPPAAVLDVLGPVATALQLAHDRDITHRDLKPANIVAHQYPSGERLYKVIDFGLAAMKEPADQTKLTLSHVFMGTVGYAAPEQLRGEPVDSRTDIYALGVIVYEMLAGRLPFDAVRAQGWIEQALTVVPPAPSRHRPELPTEIDAVVMRALAKRPVERWPSVAEFFGAFERAVGTVRLPAASVAAADSPLARYTLGPVLGRGRLGSLVYRGTHRALGVPVAIRLLRRDEQPHWDAVKARFLIEAQTLQVPHRHLLQVRDFGEDDRLVYMITEFVEGTSLRQELAAGGVMPWPRALNLLRQMLDATAALNERGGFIVGVNPDMIRLTTEGGSERIVLSTAGLRSVQDVLATMREQELRGEEANEKELPYIAPEVLLGHGPEPASDVFTIGVLVYEMVTGTRPFLAPSLPELLGQMLQARPASARSINADVPDGPSALIDRCLVPDPRRRMASAQALLSEL